MLSVRQVKYVACGAPSNTVAAIVDPTAMAAIRLTLIVAAIVVPINLVFGLAAAWAIAKFEFPGRGVLVTIIDARSYREETSANMRFAACGSNGM